METAHEKGCDFVRSLASVNKVNCDIAISTNVGYPLDQNIYQAIKGMTAAEATLPDAGIIITIAGCRDGHGGVGFYHNIADVKDPEEFEQNLADSTLCLLNNAKLRKKLKKNARQILQKKYSFSEMEKQYKAIFMA